MIKLSFKEFKKLKLKKIDSLDSNKEELFNSLSQIDYEDESYKKLNIELQKHIGIEQIDFFNNNILDKFEYVYFEEIDKNVYQCISNGSRKYLYLINNQLVFSKKCPIE